MPRGGPRPNAGRKPKHFREPQQAQARGIVVAANTASSRLLATEILSRAANSLFQKAIESEAKDERVFRDFMMAAANVAKALAPYQTAAIAPKALLPDAVDLSRISDADLALVERIYLAAAAPGPLGH